MVQLLRNWTKSLVQTVLYLIKSSAGQIEGEFQDLVLYNLKRKRIHLVWISSCLKPREQVNVKKMLQDPHNALMIETNANEEINNPTVQLIIF